MGTGRGHFAFAPGVGAWQQRLGTTRDAIRQELVAIQLAEHLPAPHGGSGPSVVDLGCGQGTQAIRLARLGCAVTGVDLSDELLGVARASAAAEPPEVRDRLVFQRGDVTDLGDELTGRFDLVCCHGVLMYLPSLDEAVAGVVGAARPGGYISLLTRNRAGIAMRAGMSSDWAGALAGFDARHYRNRLGIDAVRADEPDEVAGALRSAGAERLCWYGVRLFSDHWAADPVPVDFARLLAAEDEAGRRDPYRGVAALTHTVARRIGPAGEVPEDVR